MNAPTAGALLLSFWLACATSSADPIDSPASARADLEAQVDFILDNPLPESDYVRSDRCIHADTYRTIEVLDTRHLLFLGRKDTVWLNQLRYACLGLRDEGVLVMEMRDRSLCDMDGFTSVASTSGRSSVPGVHCTLGHFEKITEAQANQLREALARRAQPPSQRSAATKEQ